MGLEDDDMSQLELEKRIKQKEVEEGFVMVNKSKK